MEAVYNVVGVALTPKVGYYIHAGTLFTDKGRNYRRKHLEKDQ